MKTDQLIYPIGSLVVVAGAVMKILHHEYANAVLIFGLVGLSFCQAWHVEQLKKKIRKLEEASR